MACTILSTAQSILLSEIVDLNSGTSVGVLVDWSVGESVLDSVGIPERRSPIVVGMFRAGAGIMDFRHGKCC